jgi:hypothetical protein
VTAGARLIDQVPGPATPAPGIVAIHAHFHRSDRRNPWTGRDDLPIEPSRAAGLLVRDCYRANAAARRTDESGAIVDIVNNFTAIGWDASPSVLDWLAAAAPWTHRRMIDADAEVVGRTGRGVALAHPYVHAILPLASDADRRTLVRWGLSHFRHTFGRSPDGMWLPEMAVDGATLGTLADEGVAATILTPGQVDAVRRGPGHPWSAAGSRELRRAHRCAAGAGRSVTCWFQDAAYSNAVSFGDALIDGWSLGARMAEDVGPGEVLGLVADGETYGLHHPRGEMALAALVAAIDASDGAVCRSYAALGAGRPDLPEVRLRTPSSWSCRHGVERWRTDCGDTVGGNPTWNQRWRRPLRRALDWLAEQAGALLDELGPSLFDDPWAARDGYAEVLVRPRSATRQRYLRAHGVRRSLGVRALSLLEIQRHALAALDSGACFGADPAAAPTVDALRHADRATQIAGATFGFDLATPLRARLAPLRGNRLDLATADELWDHFVAGARTDGLAVARAEALRRIVGAPGISNDRWHVRALGARLATAGTSRARAARYVVTDQTTGARESHILLTLDDGRGRLEGASLASPAGDLSKIAARACRRGLAGLGPTSVFGPGELPPADQREVVSRQAGTLTRHGLATLGVDAGIAMINDLTRLGADVPAGLAHAVADGLAGRFRKLLDHPVIDERAAARLLSDRAALAWVSDRRLASVIDTAIVETTGELDDLAPPAERLRRLAALARLSARSGVPAPSIWWVQNAVVRWREAIVGATPADVQSALAELAGAIDVAWPAAPLPGGGPGTVDTA